MPASHPLPLSLRSVRLLVAAVVAVGSAAMLAHPRPALATGTGPKFIVSTPSLVGGKVQFPVVAWLPVSNSYNGFTIHLRWNPTVFSFNTATAAGGVFDPTANPATGFCVTDQTSYDSDGGGVIFSCAGWTQTITSYHILATFTLNPAATGCSAIHLFTYAGTDGGDSNTGTFTVNFADFSPQSNAYLDATSNVSGQRCTP